MLYPGYRVSRLNENLKLIPGNSGERQDGKPVYFRACYLDLLLFTPDLNESIEVYFHSHLTNHGYSSHYYVVTVGTEIP